MFKDCGLENYLWVPEVGNGIGSPGSPNPTISIAQPKPGNPWLTVSTDGAAYADGLAKLARPLLLNPANKGVLTYAYQIMTDARTPGSAQALETTPRIVLPDGRDIAGDFQVNYQKGGMVQIWQSAENPWADTGIVIGKYTPGTVYSVEIDYTFDLVKGTSSLPWFSINGKVFQVPQSMQNVPLGTGLGWPPGIVVLQKQLD